DPAVPGAGGDAGGAAGTCGRTEKTAALGAHRLCIGAGPALGRRHTFRALQRRRRHRGDAALDPAEPEPALVPRLALGPGGPGALSICDALSKAPWRQAAPPRRENRRGGGLLLIDRQAG